MVVDIGQATPGWIQIVARRVPRFFVRQVVCTVWIGLVPSDSSSPPHTVMLIPCNAGKF